jgi:hypothetical protein
MKIGLELALPTRNDFGGVIMNKDNKCTECENKTCAGYIAPNSLLGNAAKNSCNKIVN